MISERYIQETHAKYLQIVLHSSGMSKRHQVEIGLRNGTLCKKKIKKRILGA
jgi:hypothetical protein